MKILVVEDSEICSNPIKNFSKKFNIEVDVTPYGKEGIELATKNTYDFILMDIWLEDGVSGFEVTESIRNLPNGSSFKIIAFSAGIYL
jgi:DNA-binding response OmpR family regulator